MILMKQTKFNYAMSKLKEIESLLNQGSGSTDQQTINSGLIVNNFNPYLKPTATLKVSG